MENGKLGKLNSKFIVKYIKDNIETLKENNDHMTDSFEYRTHIVGKTVFTTLLTT